ncbi:MAG: FtsW/RodA/SpoVE family cell cycle protein [bacterium]|nr:FtsW/RodA/SpoVE family cell cycle protein [bacterium]
MRKLYKNKIDKNLIYTLAVLSIISLLSIYSAGCLVGNKLLVLKQILWILVSIFVIYIILKIGNNFIYKNYKYLYIFINLLLLLLLIFGKPINNSKCWFNIFGITIQPSEFAKIILIITNAMVINNHFKNNKNKELFLIIKILIITIIPSILTFLEPDTGVVIIYVIISFTMLFISNINIKWFTISILLILLFLSIFLSMYFYNSDTFIKIFGTNFFYRIDRLLDWKDGVGMQLVNAKSGIGAAHIFGFGFNNTPIYFPEAQTDFIFSVFAINYGFIGAVILIATIVYLDIHIIKIGINAKNKVDKCVVSGIISMLIFSQVQNIGMNIGLLPITGITLPFISYGGSSLISNAIAIGILLNIKT